MFNWSRRGASSSTSNDLPVATATAATAEDEALAEALRRSVAPPLNATPRMASQMGTASGQVSSQEIDTLNSDASTSTAPTSTDNNEVGWACEMCTFENPSPAPECALCQSPRPLPTMPSAVPQFYETADAFKHNASQQSRQGANRGVADQNSLDLSAFLTTYARSGPTNTSAHGTYANTTARLEGVLVAPDGARFSVGPLEAPTSALHEHLDALVAAGFGLNEHNTGDSELKSKDQGSTKAPLSINTGLLTPKQGVSQTSTKDVNDSKNSLPVVNLDGTIAGANADDFHVAQPEDQPSILDGNYFRGQAWADIIGRRDQPVGPEQLAPRERLELADRNAQLETSRRGRRGAGADAGGGASASRYGTRVNPNSTQRGFDDLEGYEQEVWIDPSRNLEHAIENPRNRQGDATGQRGEGGAATPTEAELNTAVLFETAGGLGAKLRNTHLVGGERVKELDFFVASVETPTVVVHPPDPAIAVAQLALQTAVPMPLDSSGSSSSNGGRNSNFEVYVQKELLKDGSSSSSSGSSGSGIGSLTTECAAACRALRWIVAECCSSKLLALPPEAMASVRITYFATMRADSSVACRSETDGFVYFNALVLQQQACFDPLRIPLDDDDSNIQDTNRNNASTTRRAAASWDEWRTWMVPPHSSNTRGSDFGDHGSGFQRACATPTQRRCWLYWLERTAMVMNHGPPTGLYDKGVRQRFKAVMAGEHT